MNPLVFNQIVIIPLCLFLAGLIVFRLKPGLMERFSPIVEETSETEMFMRNLNNIAHDPDRNTDQKIRDVLELGLESLDLEIGFISSINDETLQFSYVQGDHDQVREGREIQLEDTYCQLTLDRDEPVYLESAESVKSELNEELFDQHDFSTYVGSKIVLENYSQQIFTVCFANVEPREESFTSSDRLKFEHLVQCIHSKLKGKHYLEKIRTNEKRIQQMAESMDEAFFLVEPDYSQGHFANAACQELSGVNLEEIYRDPTEWDRHVVDEDREKIEHFLLDQRVGEFTEHQKQNYRIDHPEKGIIHVEARVYPVRENGELVRVAGVAADITSRVEAEQALKETVEELRETRVSRNQLQKILDTINAGVFIVNEDGIISTVNESILEMTHYENDTLVGRDVDTIFKEDTSPGPLDGNSDGELTERQLERSDGESLPVLFSSSRIQTDQESMNRVCSVIDITDRKNARKAIRERERRFRAVFNSSFSFVGLLEPDGTLIEANDTALEFGGLDREDVVGKPFWEAHWWQISEETQQELKDSLKRAQDGEFVRYEVVVYDQNSEPMPIDFSLKPVKNEKGNVELIVPEGRPIADIRKARRKLKESQQRFEKLANNLDEIFWIVEPDWSQFEYINPAYEDIVGRSREKLLNEDPTDLLEGFHPDDRQKSIEMMERASDGENVNFQVRANPDEDYQRRLLIHARTVEDDDGSVEQIIGTARDITDLSTVKEELKQTNRRLTALVENTSEAIYIKNREGEYIFVNQAVTDILGQPRDEILGKTDRQLFDRGSAEAIREDDLTVMNLEQSITEEVVRYVNDERYVFISNKYPYKDQDGEVIGIMGISRDIRDQKETEERLQEALDEKTTLIREVHHRVKNNLQLIYSMLDLQKDEVNDPAIIDRLEDSLNRVESIALIHDTLYQSEGLADLDFGQYVDRLINSIFQTYATERDNITIEKNIKVDEINLDTAIPCGIILTELITNCFEHAFTSGKTGKLDVNFVRTEGQYTLSVIDNGPGLENDFDPTSDGNLGFELVETLVNNNLDGFLEVDGTDGTSVSVVFKL